MAVHYGRSAVNQFYGDAMYLELNAAGTTVTWRTQRGTGSYSYSSFVQIHPGMVRCYVVWNRNASDFVLRIGEVASPGLGHWSRAWDMIAEPSDAFLDALAAWEANDTSVTRDALHSAASEFVRVWRSAADAWDAEGRPGVSETLMAHSDA